MANIRDQNPYEIDLPFEVKEGNYTVVESAQGRAGNDEFGYFASPIHKGDFVKLSSTPWLVEKAESGDTIIGEVLDNPAWFGDRPQESKTDGNYNRRRCTVRLWGDYIKNLTLVEDNSAVAVGDSLEYAGDNKFDVADSSTSSIALESSQANKGARIAVLFGYRGL